MVQAVAQIVLAFLFAMVIAWAITQKRRLEAHRQRVRDLARQREEESRGKDKDRRKAP